MLEFYRVQSNGHVRRSQIYDYGFRRRTCSQSSVVLSRNMHAVEVQLDATLAKRVVDKFVQEQNERMQLAISQAKVRRVARIRQDLP